MTREEKVIELLTAMPKQTAQDVREYLDVPYGSASGLLSVMLAQGKLITEPVPNPNPNKSRGRKRMVTGYSLNPDAPKGKVPYPYKASTKPKAPTDAALQARIDEMQVKINELATWKADAIKRYPDLAVAPELLEAQRIAAMTLREAGDHVMASTVESGLCDGKPLVRAVLAALSQ